MSDGPSCSSCRFYLDHEERGVANQCRRRAPTVIVTGVHGDGIRSRFPEVSEHTYCGEYVAGSMFNEPKKEPYR